MPYADTDFFIALARSDDRMNGSALTIYERYKGKIYTSLTTLIELALIATRLNKDVGELIESVLDIATVKNSDRRSIILAVSLIKEKGVGVFDAFHAGFCDGEIISSDHVYDRIGVHRIKL